MIVVHTRNSSRLLSDVIDIIEYGVTARQPCWFLLDINHLSAAGSSATLRLSQLLPVRKNLCT